MVLVIQDISFTIISVSLPAPTITIKILLPALAWLVLFSVPLVIAVAV